MLEGKNKKVIKKRKKAANVALRRICLEGDAHKCQKQTKKREGKKNSLCASVWKATPQKYEKKTKKKQQQPLRICLQ